MRKNERLLRKILSYILVLSLFISNVPNVEVFATESNYVEIWTAEDLDNVRNNTKLNYRLMADIDLSDYVSKTNTVDKGWYPLGYGNHFTGVFDGNGHTISGLWSSRNWGISYKGLFSVITNGAVVKDLNIVLDERGITGGYEVGGITGVAKNGAVITNCTVTGGQIIVTGGGYAGGIVGFTYGTPSVTLEGNTVTNTLTQTSGNYSGGIVGVAGSGTKIVDCKAIDTTSKAYSYAGGIAGGLNGKSSIENAYTNGKVEIRASYAGGLVGVVYEGSTIKSGYAEGDVNSSHYAGGLVGTLYGNSTIEESYATGNVTTKYYIAGGLVGEAVASTISNSYARGNVTGTTGVGGLVGYFSGNGASYNKSVENSYSTGVVTGRGTTEYGAFNGRSGVVYKGSNFYNSEIASVVQAYGTSGNPQGETTAFPQGKSTEDMMKEETFVGFDFDNIWSIEENVDYPILKSSIKEIDYITDTDEDGLSDYLEDYFNTNPLLSDTDGDGLLDGEEIYLTYTNPLKVDTDDNGILDPYEDFDNDGLTNIEEVIAGSYPREVDSDFDGLTDYEEVKAYFTDPLLYDTDDDRLSDRKEIEFGLDPNNPDTDGDGILDGEEHFNIVKDYNEEFKGSTVIPSLDIELEGYQLDSLKVYQASEENIYTSKDIPGFIGNAYDFRVIDDITEGTITFKYEQKLRSNNDELAIYEIDKANQEMILLPNQIVDKNNRTVSAPIDSISNRTYILLNKTLFDKEFMLELVIPDFEVDLDVVFAIDSSGSMVWNDPTDIRKDVVKNFIDILGEDDRVGIVDFDSSAYVLSVLTKDKENAKNAVNRIDSSGGTNISEAMRRSIGLYPMIAKNLINEEMLIDENNDEFYTYDIPITFGSAIYVVEEGINGYDIYNNKLTSGSAISVGTRELNDKRKARFIILLTDGEGSYSSSYTNLAKENDITVYTVGLGDGVNKTLLESIANGTNGRYFHADSAEDLIKEFEAISADIEQLITDSDRDGLSDYHEKHLRLFNGAYLNTDPNEDDTDGDGLTDFEEIEFVYEDGNVKYFKMLSNPTLNDTDGDGLNDKEDSRPLIWDVSDRHLAMSATIVYDSLPENAVISNYSNILDKRFNGVATANELKEWSVYDTHYSKGGLQVATYKIDDNLIVSYRGSDQLYDDWFVSNILGFVTGFNAQVPMTKDYIELILSESEDLNVYILGHSLGGYLAYNAGAKALSIDTNSIKGIWHFNGLGLHSLYADLKDEQYLVDNKEKITNYIVKGEFLNSLPFHYQYGKKIIVFESDKADKDNNGNVSTFEKHDMISIIDYFN